METESSPVESMMDAEKSLLDPSMLDPGKSKVYPKNSMLDSGESKVDPKNFSLDAGESRLEPETFLLDPHMPEPGVTRLEPGTSVFDPSRLDSGNSMLEPGKSTLDKVMSMSEPFMLDPKKSKLDPGNTGLSPRKFKHVQKKARFDPGYSRPSQMPLSTENNDLDVVNLSSQILSLGIVSQDSKQTRKVSKHVRFLIPEDEHEDKSRTGSRRRKSPELQCQPKKRPVRKTSSFENDTAGRLNDKIRIVAPPEALTTSCCLSAGDKPSASEPMELCDDTSRLETMDKNDNCSICSELVKEATHFKLGINKSRSDSQCSFGKKLLLHRRFIQKQRAVVSKKYCLKRKYILKPKAKQRKRKHGNNPKGEEAKKRKLIISKTNSKRNITQISRPTAKFVKDRERSTSKLPSKSRSSSPKARRIKYQVKKALYSKSAKQKYAQKQLRQRLKRIAMKKLALKQKNKGRKHQKSKRKTSKKKKAKKRGRKLKLKKRKMDLVVPMQILLLKSLTFKTAEEKEYECCRRYCWDDWEDINIGDVIDEHD